MRLIRYQDFKVNESIDEHVQYITEEDLEYALQGVKDINDDILEIEINFKLMKELKGAQKDSQYILNFPDQQNSEDLEYEFYDEVIPGAEGYIAYEIAIHYDWVNKSELGEEAFIFNSDTDELSVTKEMESEINRLVKRIRADYKVSTLEWYVENGSSLSNQIKPIIKLYFYKPFLTKVTVNDFVKLYNIYDYTVENGKLYMDVLMTDLVPVFCRDDKQEEWLCKSYIDDDYFWDYDTSASDIDYALNKENGEKLMSYFANKYFEGNVEALKEEAGDDLESMIKHFNSEGDPNVEHLYDTYRNMYCSSLQDKHSQELEAEFFRYIARNYGLENPVKVGENIEQQIDVKYKYKDDDGKLKDKWVKETAYPDKYRFQFDFDCLKYYDIEKAKGMSLWELWREANDPERVHLEPHYSDYGDVDNAEFNKEISSIFE